MVSISDILGLFEKRGSSQYGGEPVTQLQHALQCAALAEGEHASTELIVAALLHDVGHLLHHLPDDAPDEGIDDHHENSGHQFLKSLFPPGVTEPVRLHVSAKRYLCSVDTEYFGTLSRPSVVSFKLQGGKMSSEESDEFEENPYAADAIRLRRWDDAAKDPAASPPPLSHFAVYLHRAATARLEP